MSSSLFEVLPSQLFRPLASANRENYWRLLLGLYEEFFGPEAEVPPATGWERRQLTQFIENYLEHDDAWQAEEGVGQLTPLNIRANMYLSHLTENGWFEEEQVGLTRTLSMTAVVSRFLATLQVFTEDTPAMVGAKMRSIEDTLRRVLDPASNVYGDDFVNAGDSAHALLSGIAAMSLNVRTLQREIFKSATPGAAIRRLFEDYISKHVMADYADLAGADHPLARKAQVLSLTQEIHYGDHRERIIVWLAERRYKGDKGTAEAVYEKAIRRLSNVYRLQDYFDRLGKDQRHIERRMLAMIEYQLRAPGQLERRIKKAIAGVNAAENFDASMPVGPGALLSGELLFQPRIARPPIPRTADSPRQMTAEQEARMNLHRRARDARTAMPTEVRVYLQGVMGGGRQIRASQLPITGIKQFRMVQTLSTYAQEAMTGLGKKHHEGISKRLPGYRFQSAGDERIAGPYLDMPDFYITKVK